MPNEWLLSRICEEFHCLPSQAIREPLDLCLRIMEARAYAGAKHLVTTMKLGDLPDSPMVNMVQEIEFDIAREWKARQRG